MSDFRPPRESRLLIGTVYGALPWIMRVRRVVRVKLEQGDWDHLEPLRNSRLILSANHPTGTDPLIAMDLARRLGQYFNFVAAREIFAGPYGWLLQRLGAYSVVRGTPDRDSLQMTRRLLAEKDRKVALFPEGETYYHNDITLPFHSGVTQLGFWALADLQRLGKEPRLPVVPVAIKYRYLDDPGPEIEWRLSRLEEAVGLPLSPAGGWYPRLLAIGERVISAMEREYHLQVDPAAPLDRRIEQVKEEILRRVVRAVGQTPPEGPLPERMRFLFNALRGHASEWMEGTTEYDRRLHARRTDEVRPVFNDLWRLHNCIAMTGHYVRDHPTCERFGDVLSRLEGEVFGSARASARREALVRIAEPLDLGQWKAEYGANRRKTVETATRVLEERVVQLLRELWMAGRPLPTSAGAVEHATAVPTGEGTG